MHPPVVGSSIHPPAAVVHPPAAKSSAAVVHPPAAKSSAAVVHPPAAKSSAAAVVHPPAAKSPSRKEDRAQVAKSRAHRAQVLSKKFKLFILRVQEVKLVVGAVGDGKKGPPSAPHPEKVDDC